MTTLKRYRPWNVKPGMVMRRPALPFESTTGYLDVQVRMVEPSRNFMTSERCWTIYGEPRESYDDGRIGTYYRDEHVTVIVP